MQEILNTNSDRSVFYLETGRLEAVHSFNQMKVRNELDEKKIYYIYTEHLAINEATNLLSNIQESLRS